MRSFHSEARNQNSHFLAPPTSYLPAVILFSHRVKFCLARNKEARILEGQSNILIPLPVADEYSETCVPSPCTPDDRVSVRIIAPIILYYAAPHGRHLSLNAL